MGDIRWLIKRDWPEVLSLEAGTRGEWDVDDLGEAMRDKRTIGLVYVESELTGQVVSDCPIVAERIAGYCAYRMDKRDLLILRLHGSDDAKLALIERLKGKLIQQKRNRLDYYSHELDTDEHAIFRKAGFSCRLAAGHFGSRDAYRFRSMAYIQKLWDEAKAAPEESI